MSDEKIQLFGSEVNFGDVTEVKTPNIQEQVADEKKSEEPVKEEAPVSSEPNTTVNENVKENVTETKPNSSAAKLAIDYKERGILPEDVDIKSDLSPEELSDMLKDNMYKEVSKKAEQDVVSQLKELGYDQDTLKKARLLSMGATDEDVLAIGQRRQAAAFKPNNTEELEYFVLNYLKYKGMDETRASRLVRSASVSELEKDFEEGVQFFNSEADRLENEVKDRNAKKIASEKEKEEKLNTSFREVIDSGKLGMLNLSESQRTVLKSQLFDKNEGGKTEYEKALSEIDKNHEAQLWVAHAILNKSWEKEVVNSSEQRSSILKDLGAELEQVRKKDEDPDGSNRILLFGE